MRFPMFLPLLTVSMLLLLGGPATAATEGAATNVMEFRYDTAVWSIVVFVLLFVLLRKTAWGPILEGLQKREETIRSAVEDARKANAEMASMKAKFDAEMATAYAKIPAMMDEARRDAELLKEEMRSQANAEIVKERHRLQRDLQIAKDQALKEIWEQAAQLATLISAKAIGRSLGEDDHRRLIDEALVEMKQSSVNN
jgi:F-type H+-transporting ATPase subunit b